MPRLPRLTAQDAERLLTNASFEMIRSKGSHRIFFKKDIRIVIPFHVGKVLHPKIVKQVFKAIEAAE